MRTAMSSLVLCQYFRRIAHWQKSALPRLFQRFAVILLCAGLPGVHAESTTFSLSTGWNLLGNSKVQAIDVATTFGDVSKVTSVWTWNSVNKKWSFYTPSLSAADLAAFAQSKGYDVLSRIPAKAGFWVNASAAMTATGPNAEAATLGVDDLQPGWNLVSNSLARTPVQFNQVLDRGLNERNRTILSTWGRDAGRTQWKFSAPSLVAQGGTGLADHLASQSLLSFAAAPSSSEGFWVNVGATTPQETATSLALEMRSAFGSDNTNAVARSLTLAGVSVYTDSLVAPSGDAGAPTGARMLVTQARGLAKELLSQGGYTGAFLNSKTSVFPLPDGKSVLLSQLLAGYVAHGNTFGATQSRALLPGFDKAKHLDNKDPSLVIVFFLREFVAPFIAASQSPALTGQSAPVPMLARMARPSIAAAVDPCGAVSEFLDDLPSSVQDAVQELIDPGRSSLFMGLVSSVVGSVVELAVDGAKSLIRHLPFVESMREVANILGGLTDMQAMFSQWTVEIKPPSGLHKTPGSPNAGDFVLTMSNGGDGFEWPQPVQSCADLLDVPLPKLDSADGSTVKWFKVSGFDDLASYAGSKDVIASNKASYSVTTANEGSAHEQGGPLETGVLAVRADIQLPGVEQLASRIGSLIGSWGQRGISFGTALAPHIGPSVPGAGQVEYHTTSSARINFNGVTERLIVSSPDGLSLNGTWSGTFASQHNSQCGGWQEVPVRWTFVNGTATLSVDLTFPGNPAFGVEACTFSFTETLTLNPSPEAPSMSTSGTWRAMFDPGWPGVDVPEIGYEMPPVLSSGERLESYVIELSGKK
jgi:hypothetical protein